MNHQASKSIGCAVLLAAAFLAAEPAAALRCGNKLVKEGMHELEVIAICGEPTSSRPLGYAIRSIDISRRDLPSGWTVTWFPGYGMYAAEVLVSEFIYNLGPRKLIRRMVFEGGFLASIETLGRGYD